MGLFDAIGRGINNIRSNFENAPPEAYFALGDALSANPRDLGRGLAGGLGAFGQISAADAKRKSLAAAFDQFLPTVPEQYRPIVQQMVQNDPQALAGAVSAQMFAKPPEEPSAIREYKFSQSQGYKGTFDDWVKDQKRAGASNTTVNVGGEKAFDRGVGEYQANSLGAMATEGVNAKGDLASINELEARLSKTPGGVMGGLQALGNSVGIPIGKGASDAQAANAIIARLVPQQRTPGSGQMSDRDVQLFKDSLPKLINTPEGNAMIIQTMKAMAQYKMDQSRIAAAAMTGQITRQQAQEALMNLPDPMQQFKARAAGTTVKAPARHKLQYNPATGTVE